MKSGIGGALRLINTVENVLIAALALALIVLSGLQIG